MATIYDVAILAGVSPKTVSRVINGDAAVSRDTRSAVEKAIAELGYIPSSAARAMRSQRSGLIGLITGATACGADAPRGRGLPDMFLVRGIREYCTAQGKMLMAADTGGDCGTLDGIIRRFMEYRVEGILYVAEYLQEVCLPDIAAKVPLVLANCFDGAAAPAVIPDDESGQYGLVKRIIEHGHRRIAYITLRPDMEAVKLRVAGYKKALVEAGISVDENLIRQGSSDGRFVSRLLSDAVGGLLALPERPSVICCGNDEMAVRVYGILRTAGLRIPEDISVAGYDNQLTIAETLYPPLTSAELPYVEMGARAAERLMELIRQGAGSGDTVEKMRGGVVWRQSVVDV
ncbi:LacI family DNA-binding transcriptional regulator [Neisseria sp.]|uniref:LacI family DNA-binding transcriptional regulator n=1 Tax=Neisseria sp. TaxID=192066 RepID=UPI0035A004B0